MKALKHVKEVTKHQEREKIATQIIQNIARVKPLIHVLVVDEVSTRDSVTLPRPGFGESLGITYGNAGMTETSSLVFLPFL
jgi:hypothetical protein